MALPTRENLLSLPRAVARQTTEVRTGACWGVFRIVSVFPGIDQGRLNENEWDRGERREGD